MRALIARTIVILFLAAFALRSSYEFRKEFLTSSVKALEPAVTTDGFLRILRVPHPTARVEEALRSIPAERPVLFMASAAQPFSTQVYFTIEMLAYPRPVSMVSCGLPGKGISGRIVTFQPSEEIGGLIYFDYDPGPPPTTGTWAAPKLYVVPYRGAAPWQSYCH